MLPARKFNSRNIFPDFFNDFLENGLERVDATIPAINVMECDKGYNLELAAPGMTKDDFKVHVNKAGNLVIEMEKKEDEKEEKKEGKYIRREFSYTKFHQTLLLPDNVDKDKIEAHVKDGVLYVTVPKAPKTLPEDEKRIIEIK